MDEATQSDEYPVTITVRRVLVLTTKHKAGCTGQIVTHNDGDAAVECTSCGPVKVETASFEV